MNDTKEIINRKNSSAIDEKMQDMLNAGYEVEFDPEEAELSGAFEEDALNEKDAMNSSIDIQLINN